MPTAHTAGWIAAAGAAVAVGGVLTQAALRAESQMFGRTLLAGRDPLELALTYDDGPNEAATPALLELLGRYNARATFFMIGRFVRQRPEIARAVQAAGHLVGNHTMTHPWLTTKPAARIREELRACNEALEDTLGAPVRYFRPPHGARRPAVLRAARELGLAVVQWNVQGNDWEPIGASGILRNLDRGMRQAKARKRGANILLHDGFDRALGADRTATVEVTKRLLERFANGPQRWVTVDAWG
ncbi:MAG TPA: polysaccharide deacetylase family protein [Acidobacteriaceae bacterium]|jgi:peptidoglycan/xylan/chitin deacetylase (PgdA/CDA1 family)|nr:polysaccharide deacetylase family protein [Acidobacteriaceae bacterium]